MVDDRGGNAGNAVVADRREIDDRGKNAVVMATPRARVTYANNNSSQNKSRRSNSNSNQFAANFVTLTMPVDSDEKWSFPIFVAYFELELDLDLELELDKRKVINYNYTDCYVPQHPSLTVYPYYTTAKFCQAMWPFFKLLHIYETHHKDALQGISGTAMPLQPKDIMMYFTIIRS